MTDRSASFTRKPAAPSPHHGALLQRKRAREMRTEGGSSLGSRNRNTTTLERRHGLFAEVRRVGGSHAGDTRGGAASPLGPWSRSSASAPHLDARRGEGAPPKGAGGGPALPALTAPMREPAVGQTVTLPDIVALPTTSQPQQDAIAAVLGYAPSITQTGLLRSGFGVTRPYTHALSGISVTKTAVAYQVRATVDNPITFQVSGGTHVDVTSDGDPDITQANYANVVSDLTPDTSDLDGRPPRNNFWASDLTVRHERFHADEDARYGREGVVAAQAWLNHQAAGSVAGVNALLAEVPGRVAADVGTAMAYPGSEERAYRDGAPLYLARANAIKAKGDAGAYAAGGRSTGLSRGSKVGIGVAGGALTGAGIGALVAGPPGAAIGAGAGALVGLIGGLTL
jgi:hypothetical protein